MKSKVLCSDCENDATALFHFRNEGASLTQFRHVPRCDLHSLKDHPQAASCACVGTWDELMKGDLDQGHSRTTTA
jgi:hypothetical protein